MNGYVNVSFKSVDTTSGSAQTITSDAEKSINIVGTIPALGKTATVGAGKVTLASHV